MEWLEWLSEDGTFAANTSDDVLEFIRHRCAAAGHQETGGIIVGYYTPKRECAIITKASEAPTDSRSGRHWFYRGVVGLRDWLARLWRSEKREYYLGEWHFHPDDLTDMSPVDAAQMKTIAETESYNCPQPLLLIVAAAPSSSLIVSMFVCPQGKPPMRMQPCSVPPPSNQHED